jgi:polyisoprenoid-binding protein YceI
MKWIALIALAACSKSGDAVPAAPTGSASVAVTLAPGAFQVIPMHSSVLFKVRHLNAGYVYGSFKDFSGTFAIGQDSKKSHIEVSVKAASVATNDDERNADITGPDFLNAKQFPELTFKSTNVDVADGGWQVTGELTIRGVTKTVSFAAMTVGEGKDPQGRRVVGFEARFPISRGDFGVSFMPEVVGPEMELIIALEGSAV